MPQTWAGKDKWLLSKTASETNKDKQQRQSNRRDGKLLETNNAKGFGRRSE